jgi:hypothetical protein
MNKPGFKILIQFFTQEVYINVNYIGLCIKINIPNIQGNICTGYHPVLIAYQVFEQLKFLGGKLNRFVGPGHLFTIQVHGKVGHF